MGTGTLRNRASSRCAGGTPCFPCGTTGTSTSKTSACTPKDQASARQGNPLIPRLSFSYWRELSIVTML
ncbi:hypothetical protein MASR1M60_22360 [Rhodocyclaceae bacterium]